MEEDTGSEEFSHNMKRLEIFTANSTEDTPENSGRRKAFLVSVIRSKTYGFVRDLLAPNRPIDKSYSEIVKVLKITFN